MVGLLSIGAVIFGTFVVAFAINRAAHVVLGAGFQLDLGSAGRVAGLGLVAASIALLGWTFRYRKPGVLFASTAIMFYSFLRRQAPGPKPTRTEPFVVVGPYRLVRHPMYLSVVLAVFGAGLFRDAPLFLIWGVVITIWFLAVHIPFEERDLEALFGDEFRRYRKQVPELFPSGRRYQK